MNKRIYAFSEGNKDMVELLGGKGANLQEMHNLGQTNPDFSGLEVPAFFTITTETCQQYYETGDKTRFIEELVEESEPYLTKVEERMGKNFGTAENPLLVSVRSGAAVSMPGMMDTILNVGLSDTNLEALAQTYYGEENDPRFEEQKAAADRLALDSYRMLLQMFAPTVFEDKKEVLYKTLKVALEEVKGSACNRMGISTITDVQDSDLNLDELKSLIDKFKDAYREQGLGYVLEECFENKDAKAAAYNQLKYAVEAVFKSSRSPRALAYKKAEGLPEDLGTAVNVQAMVFGNLGQNSATGVVFTRNNATGEKNGDKGQRILYGDWLQDAQGEAVVAGTSNTNPIPALRDAMPKVYANLEPITLGLEKYYKDMQDIEFTVENGRLWILQTRGGKRAALAKLVCAVDMVNEDLILPEEALSRFSPSDMEALMHPVFDPQAEKTYLSKGLNAGPGEVSGIIALSPEYAVELAEKGKDVVLIREETSPEDVHGMLSARGVYTKTGGLTSHAAIVGKQYNKAVVVGDKTLEIKEGDKRGTGSVTIGDKTYHEGKDFISISGTTGDVYEGQVPTIESEIERVAKGELATEDSRVFQYSRHMLGYARSVKKMGVRANADTGVDSKVARLLGAEGIGLLRTEHTMFNEKEQIYAMREMILASELKERLKALNTVEELQIKNFLQVFKEMDGLPITVRLLDPPLDEFLPNTPERLNEFLDHWASKFEGNNTNKDELKKKIEKRLEELREANPMMGFRGNRLSVVYPEITQMQARSIFEAMYQAKLEGYNPQVEIMAPVTICEGEIEHTKGIIDKIRVRVDVKYAPEGVDIGEVPYGTMIETPRAALNAGAIAKGVDFFSFGTNDLTQLTCGVDRNSGGYLGTYVERGYLPGQPFATIDKDGTGKLVTSAISEGRQSNLQLKLGVCGVHGGDPASIDFFQGVGGIGLDYVSCGAYKVPVAIIAAAHAQLNNPRRN